MASRPVGPVTPPRALLLDLDETLLDNSPHQDAITGTSQEIAAMQPGLDSAQLAEANARVWEAYWPEVEDKWTLGALDGAAVSLEAWRRTLRMCGCSDESVVQRAAHAHGRLARASYRLFDDAHELLASASGARTPLALVTNGAPDTQRAKLSMLKVEGWFAAVVISGELGIAKPDPAIFELALDSLEVAKGAVWHVGDSLTADVAGANAAGLTSVWLNRTAVPRANADPEPDIEIRSLSELVPLLAK